MMIDVAPPPAKTRKLADVLGDVPAERILLHPAPGTATEADYIALIEGGWLGELVDGILVEKPRGWRESRLEGWLIELLTDYLKTNRVGVLFTPDAPFRINETSYREPDVAIVPWYRLPREYDGYPIAGFVFDFAIEVLSESNRPGEMRVKRREYFAAGCRLVWEVDPPRRIVRVYTAPETCVEFCDGQTLDGGDALPGLSLSVTKLFDGPPRPEGM